MKAMYEITRIGGIVLIKINCDCGEKIEVIGNSLKEAKDMAKAKGWYCGTRRVRC